MWPIVERELRVASRRRGTYWLRAVSAFIAILLFGWLSIVMVRSNLPTFWQGRFLFLPLFGTAFSYCLFAGARLTADCVSEEKREGTLGLLFLTDLKGFDIVLGKLAATSLGSLYAVLAIVPVVALPIQLGGITGLELLQSALVLLNTTFFSLSTGLLVSTLSRSERKAMYATVLIISILTAAPFFVVFTNLTRGAPGWQSPFLMLSPAYAFCHIAVRNTPIMPFLPGPPGSFWVSLAGMHVAGWAFLLIACRVLPSVWQERNTSSWWLRQRERVQQWTLGHAEARRLHRARLLNVNPFLWLVSRERWKPHYAWGFLAAMAAIWGVGCMGGGRLMLDEVVSLPMALIVTGFFKVWVTSEVCTRLAEDRRIGALELLLSTSLRVREILHGQWLALRRQFAWPLAAVIVLQFLLLAQRVGVRDGMVNAVLLVADVMALGWIGMWFGLTARSLSRAIFGALGWVFAFPWVLFHVIVVILDINLVKPEGTADYLWLGICLATDFVVGFWWARSRLLEDFREAATRRYEGKARRWFRQTFRGKREAPLVLPSAAMSEGRGS